MKALFICLLLTSSLLAIDSPEEIPSEKGRILVHNRIMAKIGTKPITMMDVAHKMDLYFYRQFPQYAESDMLRYQFYMANWRPILDSLIDEQLILSDAAEKEITVTDGEVREEIENLFGPNIIFNLEKIGLPRDEADTLVRNELITKKMVGMMVRVKALADVHPKKIRLAYEGILKKNPPEDVWKYRMITLRGGEESVRKALAEQIVELIEKDKKSLDSLPLPSHEGISIKMSEEYARKEKEISLGHKAILQTIRAGKGSVSPVQNEAALTRLFCLISYEVGKPPLLSTVEEQIRKNLLEEANKKRMEAYISTLRERFGVDQEALKKKLSQEFEPFVLY